MAIQAYCWDCLNSADSSGCAKDMFHLPNGAERNASACLGAIGCRLSTGSASVIGSSDTTFGARKRERKQSQAEVSAHGRATSSHGECVAADVGLEN